MNRQFVPPFLVLSLCFAWPAGAQDDGAAASASEKLREAKLEVALEQFKRVQMLIFERELDRLLGPVPHDAGDGDARAENLLRYAHELEAKILEFEGEPEPEQEKSPNTPTATGATETAKPPAFPAGTFRAQQGEDSDTVWSLVFDGEGGIEVRRDDELAVSGTYHVAGEEILFQDTGGPRATDVDTVGRYRWALAGDTLTFEAVDDGSPSRAKALTSKPWKESVGSD